MQCDPFSTNPGLRRSAQLASCLIFALLAPVLAAPVTIADPGTFVVDRAGVINPGDEQYMESMLRELEQKTTAEVKVLTVQTTGGEDVFSFAQRHAEKWVLGKKGKDNGILIVLAIKEKRIQIQTGYGLESAVPDSWIGTASRQVRDQYFKRGQYSAGLRQLTTEVAQRVAEASGAKLTQVPAGPTASPGPVGPRSGRSTTTANPCCCFLLVVVVLLVISALGRSFSYNRGGHSWLPWLLFWMFMNSGRGHSHWGSGGVGRGFGGGFGGGGFGGGGSFGGGGRFGGGGGGASW